MDHVKLKNVSGMMAYIQEKNFEIMAISRVDAIKME